MRRRLFTFAATISLVLFAGAVVFWIRSYSLGDELRYYRKPRLFGLESNKGHVNIAWGQLVSHDHPPPSGWNGSFWPFHRAVDIIDIDIREGTTFGFSGARWGWQQPTSSAWGWDVTFPYWVVTGALVALPLQWIIRFRKWRRMLGRCNSCGYNLTANTSGVCPECGFKIENQFAGTSN